MTPTSPLAGPPLDRVLVATDLSRAARAAVDRVALLPLAPTAHVELVHVTPDTAELRRVGSFLAAVRRALDDQARHLATALTRRGLRRVAIATAITAGSAFAEILRRAEKTRPDLVVVGRHGAGGMKALLIGSTAERVVRGRAAPVLVATPPAHHPYTRPGFAVDPSVRLPPFLDIALRVLPTGLRRVEILGAFDVAYAGYMRAAGVSPKTIHDMQQHSAKESRQTLTRLLEGQLPEGTRAIVRLRRGDPRFVISRMASEHRYDLLVIGTNARRGLARFLLGSVAAEVMRTTRGDVLVVPLAR